MSPQISQATVVAFDFNGASVSSQDPSNLLSGSFKAVDSFSGQFIDDTSKAQTYYAPSVYYFLEGASIAFTSGGITFSVTTAASTQACWPSAMNRIEPFNVDVSDNSPAAGSARLLGSALTYDGRIAPGSPTRSLLQLRLEDLSQSALSSNALPTNAPDLSAFSSYHRVNLFAGGPGFMAPSYYNIEARVTSISALPAVPEPATLALFFAGLAVLISGIGTAPLWRYVRVLFSSQGPQADGRLLLTFIATRPRSRSLHGARLPARPRFTNEASNPRRQIRCQLRAVRFGSMCRRPFQNVLLGCAAHDAGTVETHVLAMQLKHHPLLRRSDSRAG